jgi:hypothetical protein
VDVGADAGENEGERVNEDGEACASRQRSASNKKPLRLPVSFEVSTVVAQALMACLERTGPWVP